MKSHTSIIATIGPATLDPIVLKKIVAAGADYFRLNFSHGSHQWHQEAIHLLRKIAPHIPIILDTKGPEIRTGDMDSPLEVVVDDELLLVMDETFQTDKKHVFVNHDRLSEDVVVGDHISLNSGMIDLEVSQVTDQYVSTRVKHEGVITSRRHVNVVQKDVSLPTITAADHSDIEFGLTQGVDIIALSFTRSRLGIAMVRKLCQEANRPEVKIIAKIENSTGFENREEIAQHADGLMCARGDLGVEMPFEHLPYYQSEILKVAKAHQKMSVVATEMLESMTHSPRPTRAEITDVSFAVWQGADAVMLSGETANGEYPVDCVKVMQKLIDTASDFKKEVPQYL